MSSATLLIRPVKDIGIILGSPVYGRFCPPPRRPAIARGMADGRKQGVSKLELLESLQWLNLSCPLSQVSIFLLSDELQKRNEPKRKMMGSE
jgi:hypothetical protein